MCGSRHPTRLLSFFSPPSDFLRDSLQVWTLLSWMELDCWRISWRTDWHPSSKWARTCWTHRTSSYCYNLRFELTSEFMLRVGEKLKFVDLDSSLARTLLRCDWSRARIGWGQVWTLLGNWIAGRWVADMSADCVLAGLMVSSPAGLGRRVCTLSLSTPLNNTQVSREIPGKRDHAGIETQAKAGMSCISY